MRRADHPRGVKTDPAEFAAGLRAHRTFYFAFFAAIACFALGLLLDRAKLAFLSSGVLFLAAGTLAIRRGEQIRIDLHGARGISFLPSSEEVSPEERRRRGLVAGVLLVSGGLLWILLGLTRM